MAFYFKIGGAFRQSLIPTLVVFRSLFSASIKADIFLNFIFQFKKCNSRRSKVMPPLSLRNTRQHFELCDR